MVSSVDYAAVTAWSNHTAVAGELRRPTAPTVGNERVVVAIIGGATGATQPTWTLTRGAINVSSSASYQECTGQPGVNGDIPIAVVTNGSTASGDSVLPFASVPANVRVGMLATHANLPLGTSTAKVIGITPTTVTLSGNATGTIASGQTVYFGNCPMWLNERSTVLTLGLVIYDETTASLQICSVAGTTGSAKPSFSATAGTATTDNTVTWRSLGLASNFGTWAAPHARLATLIPVGFSNNAGDIIIADNHAETQAAAMGPASTYTTADPLNIWCIDRTAALPFGPSDLRSDPYTVSNPACAQITTTGANAQVWSGPMNAYGIVFNSGTGATSVNINMAAVIGKLERCSLRKLGTLAPVVAIQLPLGDLIDCTLQFGAVSEQLRNSSIGPSRWLNSSAPAIIGATIPTTLFSLVAGVVEIDGVDLSAMDSGKTIIGPIATAAEVRLRGIKTGAGVTIAATPTHLFGSVQAVWTDSAGNNYQQGLWRYPGTLNEETTIVRTGGATDGTTQLSHKIVTNANCSWINPFEGFTLSVWNDVVGSPVTLSVYGTWDGSAPPSTDDIWIEGLYFGDAGSPLVSKITSTKSNNFSQPAALSSDGSAWGGGTTPFKMSVTFTPQQKGPVRALVRTGRPSSTFYYDPQPVPS